jgi:hypothetical protein
MTEVGGELATELAEQEAVLDVLLSQDLARLNDLAKNQGVPYVVTPS